jgi:hypothetical protein
LALSIRKRQAQTDPDRKARFREEARGIVHKDRDDRRYKRSADTAGAIARALERAWREGFASAQRDDPTPSTSTSADDGPIPWHLIPPRPRTAFWTICLWFIGKNISHVDRGSMLIPGVTPRGTPGWTLVRDPTRTDHNTIGDRTIQPLIHLGLLEMSPGAERRLLVTPRGRETWEAFLARGGQYPEDLTGF